MLQTLNTSALIKTTSVDIPADDLQLAKDIADIWVAKDERTKKFHPGVMSVLDIPELSTYRGVFMTCAAEYMLAYSGNCKIEIVESWLTKSVDQSKFEYHELHTHPADLTIVMHLTTGGGDLKLLSPVNSSPHIEEFNYFNQHREVFSIEPVEGKITIFPSHMEHCVDNEAKSEPRYSLACDFRITEEGGL